MCYTVTVLDRPHSRTYTEQNMYSTCCTPHRLVQSSYNETYTHYYVLYQNFHNHVYVRTFSDVHAINWCNNVPKHKYRAINDPEHSPRPLDTQYANTPYTSPVLTLADSHLCLTVAVSPCTSGMKQYLHVVLLMVGSLHITRQN